MKRLKHRVFLHDNFLNDHEISQEQTTHRVTDDVLVELSVLFPSKYGLLWQNSSINTNSKTPFSFGTKT